MLLEDGRQIGVMPLQEALNKAKQLALDLVETVSNANPPICKIVSYGKFKYQTSKKKKQTPVQSKIKEVKFRVSTDDHDYQVKISRVREFLEGNNKVRIRLQFRGRENIHKELGIQLFKKLIGDLNNIARVDQEPRISGNMLTMVLSVLSQKNSDESFA